jgi:hypothetical protein
VGGLVEGAEIFICGGRRYAASKPLQRQRGNRETNEWCGGDDPQRRAAECVEPRGDRAFEAGNAETSQRADDRREE